MQRGPIRRYGRTVITDTQLAFDNIISEQTNGAPFCSSDSSHTSSQNSSLSPQLQDSPKRPITRHTRKNIRTNKENSSLKAENCCKKGGHHDSLKHGSRHGFILFNDESLEVILCTPSKKKKQPRVLKERNVIEKTNTKVTQQSGCVRKPTKRVPGKKNENSYCQDKIPDFDSIAQDDLIIDTSTPQGPCKRISKRLGHNASMLSPTYLNVSNISLFDNIDVNYSASSPGHCIETSMNCSNITFRRCKQTSVYQNQLKKSKNKLSSDSGNLSDGYATSDKNHLSDSNMMEGDRSQSDWEASMEDSSSRSPDSTDVVVNSFQHMRLRSHDNSERPSYNSHSSIGSVSSRHDDDGQSTEDSELIYCGSPVLLDEYSSCGSHNEHISMPLIIEEDSYYSEDEDEQSQKDDDDEEEDDDEEDDDEDDSNKGETREDIEKEEDKNCNNKTSLECINSMSFSEKLSNSSFCKDVTVTAKERLLSLCGQTEVISFSDCIPTRMMSKCVKIGEGVYGEVFRTISQGEGVALKIVPIEGDQLVNDCPQKKFEEILPEVVIAKELSDLSRQANQTQNFCQVQRISCVKGVFPSELLEQWDLYSQNKVSENDRPDIFTSDQLFVVFEFIDGGCPLENYKFSNHGEAFSVLRQIVFALAAAECELEFEHRDLHIGNVLVRSCTEETVGFKLHDQKYEFATEGVTATIIDFTLSRLKKDGCAIFFDISTDDGLFEGKGDFQFDVYRDMQTENGNNWQPFCPHSNVLWINYICKKFMSAIKFKDTGRNYRDVQRHLRSMVDNLLDYSSCLTLAQNNSFWQVPE